MPRQPVPELTQQSIKKARSGGESVASLAARFKVSERTIQRICSGVNPKLHEPAIEVVKSAISHGARITVDGIDLTQHLIDDINQLSGAMSGGAEPKSLEGVAGVKLKYMQYLALLNPPTMAEAVDQLIARPDFDPAEFVRLLKERYDQAS
jgi:hypothetical protein